MFGSTCTRNPGRRNKLATPRVMIALLGAIAMPAFADEPFARELDAYCVTADGTRTGVAASQDGATNIYVWQPRAEPIIIRSVHSRRTVSQWHRLLDEAKLDAMPTSEVPAPYCAIERTERGRLHSVRWELGAGPQSLAPIFGAIPAAKL
ncbi:hypothetical protein DEVEQU_00658 [Devosia equisanguinis]|uniref:Uncharacterized protein n=2 Tax=Devosia equisanguinis TaxID=2490941 RepID=A0A3S4EJU8_9HYPH|nr:hypothetical protein DEVEQU_00658 [Devosia equisanguinis]